MYYGLPVGLTIAGGTVTIRRNVDTYAESFFDDDWEDEEEVRNVENTCVDCGEQSVGDACAQCGMPLCVMCAECGAGFCELHPDKNFKGF